MHNYLSNIQLMHGRKMIQFKSLVSNIAWSIGLICLTTACSKDTPDDRNKIDIAQTIEFQLNFAEFNSDEEVAGTRSGNGMEKTIPKYVDLGNGLLAQISVQKDTTENKNVAIPETRALNNGTYTMLAYFNGNLVGEMKGTVFGGIWTPTDGKEQLQLVPGTYDFVCFNNKINRIGSGDQLTVSKTNAESALIGRVSGINVSGEKQQIAFQMKHAGARMKVKLTGPTILPNITAVLNSTGSNIPSSAVYNASDASWSTDGNTTLSQAHSFPSGALSSTSTAYTYFLPNTDASNLKLTFGSGRILDVSLAGKEVVFNPTPELVMAANDSYIINVRFAFNFLYLMSNGDVGSFAETTYGGGTKTPVAVVLSPTERLAVALHELSSHYKWSTSSFSTANQYQYAEYHDMVKDMQGYKWTWESYKNTIKGNSNSFPAFRAAGNYNLGAPFSGSLFGKKWHLPSLGEWSYVFLGLGRGDSNTMDAPTMNFGMQQAWRGDIANIAFTQVSGTPFSHVRTHYWSSSEAQSGYAGSVIFTDSQVEYVLSRKSDAGSTYRFYVRPFIKY